MTNFANNPTWEEGIRQFETSDPVEGGPEGVDNIPLRQLSHRTDFLKDLLEGQYGGLVKEDGTPKRDFVPHASLTHEGIVQLSSSITTTDETKAATPKAVSDVRQKVDDLKLWIDTHPVQTATTSRQGVVQLSSSTASTDETKAATPKAVHDVKAMADGKVNRSGDTMTGVLTINAGDWSGVLLRNASQKYARVEVCPDSNPAFMNIVYRKPDGNNEAVIYVPKKNGTLVLDSDLNNKVSKTGDTMTGVLTMDSSEYSCILFKNKNNKQMRVEVNPENNNYFGKFIYQTLDGKQFFAEVKIPKKNGTLIVDSQFTRTGTDKRNSVRIFPDGTMIQTYVIQHGDLYPGKNGDGSKQSFNWPRAFAQPPMVFAQFSELSTIKKPNSGLVNTIDTSTATRCDYVVNEVWDTTQAENVLKFIGFGRAW